MGVSGRIYGGNRSKIRTEELSETGTTREQEAGRRIEVGTELGEGRDFTVLGKVQLQRTSKLLHDLAEE